MWVKTASPNQLWFTDDDNTATQLGVGGAETNNLEGDGAANIADTEIFIGDGAGTGNYAAFTGVVALANTGATSIIDGQIVEDDLAASFVFDDDDLLNFSGLALD
ncbi:hypothetical protein ACFL2J_07955 [Candidatus Omnitrophota bacterium]